MSATVSQSRDAHCISTLDPRLAADAGLSARFAWWTERFMIDRAAVLATETCGDRRMARQIFELYGKRPAKHERPELRQPDPAAADTLTNR
jgi:hypothetical protein